MKKRNLLVVASALLLCNGSLQAMEITVGPFDFQFNAGFNDRGAMTNDPICRAISQQKKLEFIIISKEKVNDKEIKITTKQVTVEPYAFGFTKDGKPVLRGSITNEKLVKEVTVKMGEDQTGTQIKDGGVLSGTFRSNKSKENVETIDTTMIRDIKVVEDSRFDVPKNLKTLFKNDITEVVCQVPQQAQQAPKGEAPVEQSK